ncbi:hypothetical protein OOK31_07590 [Streptomyces sp. NBC_00249]|uniref:hypothetical protein n=1 Tax=Streptomyces sp. NBC_00249 TaxID=2975690 RepID=UPI002253E3E6|nr:hypothetical protein [Streptomyces sp. NBC_00249]MCX5193753.1 hypothetical protein [Streptomyces sp. NBC_00249]
MSETLALVESPAQLLNVLEWAHVHPGEAASLTIAVLQPTDPRSRAQVRRLCRYASGSGVVWRRYEVRAGYLERAHELVRLGRAVAAADRLVIGDLFSRTIQLLLPRSKAREVVVVDDGTATTELVSLLTEGQALSRWHQGEVKGSAKGGPVNRWLARADLARATFFTCMPVTAPPGTEVRPNEYAWSRESFGPVRVRAGADLAGSSLVETGVVDQDRYIEAVGWIARSRAARRYLAHRRESPQKLERIAGTTGMEIVHPELPLELTALTEPIGQSVLTFASTVAYTLPIVLRGAPVRVELCELDDAWITPDTARRSVEFLHRISALAVARHGLARIPSQAHPRSETLPAAQ